MDYIDTQFFNKMVEDYTVCNLFQRIHPSVTDIEAMIARAVYMSKRKCSHTRSETGNVRSNESRQNLQILEQYNKEEMKKWKLIESSKDPKDLWKKVDWKGDLNYKQVKQNDSVDEFADTLTSRCSLPVEDSCYDDITTNVFNPTTDSTITYKEVYECAHLMKKTSASKCGTPIQLLLIIITGIAGVLSSAFNRIFLGEIDIYPLAWRNDEMLTRKREIKCYKF